MSAVAFAASDCSVYRRYQASTPENVRQTESMLAEAGFQKIVVDPSNPDSLASQLTPYELRSYPASGGQVIWYYDPDQCSCVFEGSQDAFDRYQTLVRQQSDLAQYAAQSEDQEIVSLNAINGTMFPPPIFWIGGSSEGGRRAGRGGGHGGGHGAGGHGGHGGGSGGHGGGGHGGGHGH
jgi:hypothetical protein